MAGPPLGIDLGTTRTIAAYADRGNYPVISFTDTLGDAHDHVPSVVAMTDSGPAYGFAALEAHEAGAPLLRSFKRLLSAPDVTPHSTIRVGSAELPIGDVLTGFCAALRESLASASTLPRRRGSDPASGPVVVSVPAHAHGAQRFLTLDAFRRAGFDVVAMVNEPSAAGFEYTHRQRQTITSRRDRVLVYDLGGGTFDASLVTVDGTSHEVLDSVGVNFLGGDDFDAVLTECALREAGRSAEDVTPAELLALTDEARDAKERLSPQSKRIALEVAGEPVTVAVEDFYAAATPLVDASTDAMAPLVEGLGGADEGGDLPGVAGIYLVGGACGLPLVPRLLRQRFGRRVHRSPHPAASTAIGLAIAADPDADYSLTDRLSRGFGVFREREGGRALGFDEIIGRDAVLPDRGLTVTRRYRAAHNLGWYRFVEHTGIEHGEPRGDLVPFAEVLFPFDPSLQDRSAAGLADTEVERREHGPLVEEHYALDPNGIVEVTITDLDTGHRQVHALSHEGSSRPGP